MTMKRVNELMKEIPELESLLYDLDLMPEQVTQDSRQEREMTSIAAHFEVMKNRLTFPAHRI